jgi:hypothetical protein
MEQSMSITCTTTRAAARLMVLLFAAAFRPILDFQIDATLSLEPPIVFTLRRPLPPSLQEQIRVIPNMTIDASADT